LYSLHAWQPKICVAQALRAENNSVFAFANPREAFVPLFDQPDLPAASWLA
jgi:hypothetical protein